MSSASSTESSTPSTSSILEDNKLATIIVLALVGFFLLCFFVHRRYRKFRYHRRRQRERRRIRYYPRFELRQWSLSNSRASPPPPYEDNRGSGISLQVLPAIPLPVYNPSTSAPDTIASSDSLIAQDSSLRSTVIVRRQEVIALERQQALMRLEGNPIAGDHMNTVSETAFNDFVQEMRLTDPRRKAKSELPLVNATEPTELRGGAGNTGYFSTGGISKHIKALILKRETGTTEAETSVQNNDGDECVHIPTKKGSRLWSRITSKYRDNRAVRKQAPLTGKRLTKNRKNTLANLEGRH